MCCVPCLWQPFRMPALLHATALAARTAHFVAAAVLSLNPCLSCLPLPYMSCSALWCLGEAHLLVEACTGAHQGEQAGGTQPGAGNTADRAHAVEPTAATAAAAAVLLLAWQQQWFAISRSSNCGVCGGSRGGSGFWKQQGCCGFTEVPTCCCLDEQLLEHLAAGLAVALLQLHGRGV